MIAAIKALHAIEAEGRRATSAEQELLAKFPGFGPLALSIFPNPVTGQFKDAGWQALGEELQSLLAADEYASAKKTTFNAFYTSPTVIEAVHSALDRLGVPADGYVLEPGCGSGNFLRYAASTMKFVGVELDSLTGRITKALYPNHDIRIEDFRDTKLPEGKFDAVVGNVPFADVRYEFAGNKLALHDYFLAKSLTGLAPEGVLAVVTTHFTLDKQNASVRELLAESADFLGAIRLPSDAFKREGTAVVTDIIILQKRPSGREPRHADPAWLTTVPVGIPSASHTSQDGLPIGQRFDGVPDTFSGTVVPINGYFLNQPEMMLGTLSAKDSLYGSGYSLIGRGDLAKELQRAIARLPELSRRRAASLPPKFVPPPPDITVSEGGFFVAPDRTIQQIVDGSARSVIYGGVALAANGTMVGRRIAGLIGLREKARRVLQAQNEGWPEKERDLTRRELNRAYDAFVHQYGPVNKTTFGETTDGTVVRRMPNLVKFREDPDAMLVMALEDYDEETGRAAKAAIMHRDVVGTSPETTRVESAEEGLLVSLDHKGRIDLPYIVELYGKPESSVIAELGDLIYRDPETQAWETADAYLSGNVRSKLKIAEASGAEYRRNAQALEAVQPEDVLPGDIDANLGAPWIPASDITEFAVELFQVAPNSIKLCHLPRDAVWSLEPDYSARQSVPATADYGTARIDGYALLDLALNMKTPAIYDVIDHGDREERILNPEETLAAKEKQKRIKERFRLWIFAEPDRTERLVRLYNDTYNALRPRLFDGSHLAFPGVSDGIDLHPHQRDAIWRGMSGGNTLLAHAVGAGKTFTMIATGMKMKEARLIRKPMFVVPNHMLEQFSREYLQLYPNARILVASKDDLTRDRRKHLTAKIASGEWDGIVVTHGSFERIGMSKSYQEEFLREQIAEYDALLIDHAKSDPSKAHRNIIKTIEKQKARREAKLKDLLAEDKKDDGLVFDELGVDYLFIDESHVFKNLELVTKMERVAGIQTGGSERAFDLFMKARYLGQKHPGHGVTFATGTPVSNTMTELYTLQRYLDPAGLAARGIEPFDAWAATFGEVVEAMEISPDGASLRPRSRFAKFTNLPELQQMVRAFADVQTADMLDLPRPKLEGGKAHVVACAMSEEQRELQAKLIERYERIRSTKVDPREDNALAITTDGRKLALDARLLTAAAHDFSGSKIHALVENVATIYKRTAANRGTQMVFCDLGVGETKWGFSVYDEIVKQLTEGGIPREQIATVGDAESDAKKQALFERVRQGSIRVLIGSTQKMGAGTNVQRRLVALHHGDAPWKPAEVEQREGRILRQGNTNAEVAIYRYVTSGSFDAYMWQALETKARFISQIITGEAAVRRADDVGGQELSYAEVKAIASGNPAVLTLAEADAELQRVAILRKNHADEQYLARKNVRDLPDRIARIQQRLDGLRADAATLTAKKESPIVIGTRAADREEVGKLLAAALNRIPDQPQSTRRYPLGSFRGLAFGLERDPSGATEVTLTGRIERTTSLFKDSQGPKAVMNALHRLADTYEEQIETGVRDLFLAENQFEDYRARTGLSFPQAAYAEKLTGLRDLLKLSLSGKAPAENGPTTEALAEQIKAIIGEQKRDSGAMAERFKPPSRRAETPVTARLKRAKPQQPATAPATEASDEPEPPRHQERLHSERLTPLTGNSLF